MWILTIILVLLAFPLQAQETATISQTPQTQTTQSLPVLSRAEMEQLLHTASIIKEKWLGTGVTKPRKLTLSDGTREFHAIFKTVDERRHLMTMESKGPELDFKDSWKFDVAAYEIDKMLDLNMVPVTVERKYKGERGAIQWWIENAFTEGDRCKKKMDPPDVEAHNRSIFKVRLFDNLVYNFDRNLGNILYDPVWRVWMIDHSRCFKNLGNLKTPADLTKFSVSMMASLRNLDEKKLKQRCGRYLTIFEIQSMMKRRDAILQLYDKLYAEKGDTILFP